MPEPPEVPDVPPERDPDLQPATRGELRTLRRWLLVTAVWAVAATAVALIALLTQDDTAEEKSRDVSERVTQLERDLNPKLDNLEEELTSVAKQQDVTKLAQRLSRVETSSSKASSDAKDVKSRIDDLETRIEDLESTADTGGDTGSGNADQQNENP
jgi:septal ring factor EnvC (AmiA/AmiB activator)